jgi:probable phosphoglycerate mutase
MYPSEHDGEQDDRPSLWLVRHGETEWSATGRHTSTTDVELTERGREQARAAGERLVGVSFRAVWSSPRRRAIDTCHLAGYAGAEQIVDDLAEWAYGADEGRTSAEIRADRPEWTVWTQGPLGGETAAEVQARADRVIERARALGGPVLAFTHGHFSRVLGARWVELAAADGARLRLSTGSVCVLGYERETPTVVHWNESGRLDD